MEQTNDIYDDEEKSPFLMIPHGTTGVLSRDTFFLLIATESMLLGALHFGSTYAKMQHTTQQLSEPST
jgi:hypothetical protein